MKPYLHRVILLLLIAGCSDANGLPDPSLTNVERTETLYALVGTPVGTPSAYAVDGARTVRGKTCKKLKGKKHKRFRGLWLKLPTHKS